NLPALRSLHRDLPCRRAHGAAWYDDARGDAARASARAARTAAALAGVRPTVQQHGGVSRRLSRRFPLSALGAALAGATRRHTARARVERCRTALAYRAAPLSDPARAALATETRRSATAGCF